MIKYDLLVDGSRLSVVRASDERSARAYALGAFHKGESGVLLFPDDDVDFGALSIDKFNNEPKEPYLPLAALYYFFGTLRGYPRMELEIKYNGKVHELLIGKNEYSFSVNVGKCKNICAKNLNFEDGIDILGYTTGTGKCAFIIPCADSELFCEDRLGALLDRYEYAAAVSVSAGGSIIMRSAPASLSYTLVSDSISVLLSTGISIPDGQLAITLNGIPLRACRCDALLHFYPMIKYIS